MTTTANDISVVLSGGTSNINPNQSLGGDPSSSPVPSGILNNLFDDVSSSEAASGIEEYRCVYIFNDGDTTIWDAKIYIYSASENGSTMEIGVVDRNEIQRISISGQMTGGQLNLLYKNQPFVLAYNSDLSAMATGLQTALEELQQDEQNFFKKVTVTAQAASNNTVVFDIRWTQKDAKRNFDKFELSSGGNQLSPLGSVVVSISSTQEGSPVNTIANEISVETNPPGGVGFYNATQTFPIVIPFLAPSDGLPLWIKRTVNVGSSSQENDGFVLRIAAESLEPVNAS